MKDKLMWMLIGYGFLACNVAMLGGRLNSVGLIFGLVAMGCFLKSLSIKQ